ncbi:MAG: bifunctional homocysteine S-methyltransferase/methylenetetrahydrofolate reductase [Chloroflexi bacterium]|nr:bifunctional homocysteine S-methyltransferase/methylenetetrahydrofolate reductase [Chloroflexota bacterium]
MTHPLLERLARGVVLCDGAMGTQLYARGISFDRCFDELNLVNPALVQEIHREYIRAGAEMIETNTFGANRFKLAHHGLEKSAREINLRGVKLAREAREIAGEMIFVLGSVGPIGALLTPLGQINADDARAAFQEQIEALLEGGADAIILETFSDLRELKIAIQAARAVTHDLPLFAQMSFTDDADTLTGNTPEQIATELLQLPIDVIGANCSVGPAGTFNAMRRLVAALEVENRNYKLEVGTRDSLTNQPSNIQHPTSKFYLSVMPNAGFPARIGERYMYLSSPQYFADYAPRFVDELGASIVGGCCGTTPAHIAAMRDALRAHHPVKETRVIRVEKPAPPATEIAPEGLTSVPRTVREKLRAGQWITSVELDPPRGLNPAKMIQGAARLKELGVDSINIGDSPLAKIRMSCIALAVMVQQKIGVETIIHFTTRDRNLMALQSDLIGAHALGIRNVIALTGDPPRMGDYPNATAVYDIDSIGLIKILKRLNEGHDWAGTSIGTNADFFVACALDMILANSDPNEIDRFHRKLDAGADFVMTQPIYDLAVLSEFLQKYGDKYGVVEKPIVLGVLPLMSSKHAEFLHNEVPGITLTDEARQRMRSAGERGVEEGIQLAQELLIQAKDFVAGTYLMPSFGRYDVCGEIVKVLEDKMKGRLKLDDARLRV